MNKTETSTKRQKTYKRTKEIGGENHNNGNEEFTKRYSKANLNGQKKKSLTSKLRDRVMEIIKSKKQK